MCAKWIRRISLIAYVLKIRFSNTNIPPMKSRCKPFIENFFHRIVAIASLFLVMFTLVNPVIADSQNHTDDRPHEGKSNSTNFNSKTLSQASLSRRIDYITPRQPLSNDPTSFADHPHSEVVKPSPLSTLTESPEDELGSSDDVAPNSNISTDPSMPSASIHVPHDQSDSEPANLSDPRDCWPQKTPAGAFSNQPPPVFCSITNTGPGTASEEANAWFDNFDHGLLLASFENTNYEVYDSLGGIHKSIHWRHGDHWMVDLAPHAQNQKPGTTRGGAMLRPNRSFNFENEKLVVETDLAAGMSTYGTKAWPEIVITTSEQPAADARIGGGVRASDYFPGHWTFGVCLLPNRFPTATLMDRTNRGTLHGGRIWEMSWFQHVGTEVFGGNQFDGRGNYWRICQDTEPESACRDRFRMELTRTSLALYVNGIKYFEQKGIPPLPDELVKGKVYVYFASMILGHSADSVRYHWDRALINPSTPPSAGIGFSPPNPNDSHPTPVPKAKTKRKSKLRPSVFPIKLVGKTPQERVVTLYADKPKNSETAILHMQVFDPDSPDEGALYVNGHGPLVLFEEAAKWFYDKRIVELQFSMPSDWWLDDANALRFIHQRAGGYRIDDAYVEFEK